jgi:hypothetical protein
MGKSSSSTAQVAMDSLEQACIFPHPGHKNLDRLVIGYGSQRPLGQAKCYLFGQTAKLYGPGLGKRWTESPAYGTSVLPPMIRTRHNL